jgi:hypothetical protein
MVSEAWGKRFSEWTGPASESEQDRYERTCRAIAEALRGTTTLDAYSFEVYPKGSYPNFTNVVRDSDVDIAVELTTFFKPRFIHAAEGLTLADVGFTTYEGDATLAAFKDDVQQALIAYFGAASVKRGDKAIRVAENDGRLPADVVPCVTERTWTSASNYNDGIRLRCDRSPEQRIVNYPKQHLEQGTNKNDLTSRRYKRVVRILKRLENQMVKEQKIAEVPSFLIESAIWNVPDDRFEVPASWADQVRGVLAYIFNGTRDDQCVGSEEWLEANALKYLFLSGQNWDFRQAHEFAGAAWAYVGFD